jgi:hypothetical protein
LGKYQDIEDIISTLDNKKIMVVIDGFVNSIQNHNNLLSSFYRWIEINKEYNRLLVICSMSSRGKSSIDYDYNSGVKEFFFYSWTLEEYQNAIKDDDFFNSIKENLDADFSMENKKGELIESKYYFAGGSSRYMFSYSTEIVIGLLNESISSAKDIDKYIDGTIGESSLEVINRLFSIFKTKIEVRQKFIISQYVLSKIGVKFGKKILQNIYKSLKDVMNPSIDLVFYMFEKWYRNI